jgi:hypothetical protein
VPETTASIVYNEALRAMDYQRASVEALRTRAATLFAGSALVTAFLGGQARTRNPNLGALPGLAIGAFVAAVGLTIKRAISAAMWSPLWPRRGSSNWQKGCESPSS